MLRILGYALLLVSASFLSGCGEMMGAVIPESSYVQPASGSKIISSTSGATAMRAAIWIFLQEALAIGGVITLVANLDKNKKGQEFVPTQKTQIEQQVDNKCEGDIFTISHFYGRFLVIPSIREGRFRLIHHSANA
jgi:hypothetical protein